MPYIGNTAADRFVASKAASVYSGDGSTTAFTLEHSVGADEDILVSVDGVIQEPSVAYAVSTGTTLTFTAAPSSNSGNNIFVYYLFSTLGTVTHPATSALSATSGTFSTTLNVTGNTTAGGTLGVTGNTTVGGTLGVTGVSTLADNIVFGASGKGVHLGVTSATASNLLEDYEEGTWTPSFTNVNSGATGGTYTKIGRMVFCTAVLQAGGTASLNITGLPFTALVGTGQRGGGNVNYQNRNTTETWHIVLMNDGSGINLYNGAASRTLAGTEIAFVSFTYITSA